MALPQLCPLVPATLCGNRSRPVSSARLEDVIRMERLATEAAEALAGASAEDVVRWATDTFGDRICIGTRDAVSAVYPVNVLNVTPAQTVAEQDEQMGPRLYSRNPDLCCYLRKVVPLEQALEPYDAWITGVRKEETDARSDTRAVQWDARREMVKVNPIVDWTQDQVDAYIAENGVLVNPLVYDGYPSIGCATCTARVEAGADARSGRWAGTGKTECGIHS